MDNFLSCDWGSSSFRLRLIDGTAMSVVAQEVTSMGIIRINYDWTERNKEEEVERTDYYLEYLRKNIEVIEARTGQDLSGIPVILSGMASSSLGIEELPYGNLPFSLRNPNLPVKIFEVTENFNHPLWLISGLKSDVDVLRGEEIQLLGLIQNFPELKNGLFLFPGTHSKHINVLEGNVDSFKTFMTGELFGLLATESIIATSIEKHQYFSEEHKAAFSAGVRDSSKENFLHSIFLVRTNQIFKKLTPQENYSYLSGLLIGTELSGLALMQNPIYLCCGSEIRPWYELAFNILGIEHAHQFSMEEVESAVTIGHQSIFQLQKKAS